MFWTGLVLNYRTINYRRLIRGIIALSILLSTTTSMAETKQSLTLGVIVFPPLSMKMDGSDECVGEAIDTTRKIFSKYHYEVKIICAPTMRIIKMLETGDVDLTINVKGLPLLEPHINYVEPRFNNVLLRLYQHEKIIEPKVAGVRGFNYLGHREILVQEGYEFIDVASVEDAIGIFLKERTKALIIYKRPYENYIQRKLNGIFPDDVVFSDVKTLSTHYGVSKRSKNHDKIIKLLSDHISETGAVEFLH